MVGAKDITCDCGYMGRGETMDERLVDKELHERTHKGLVPPDAAQAKDEAEMAKFVVGRVQEEKTFIAYHFRTMVHKTLESAKAEATRLATKHAIEIPRFEVYKLDYQCAVEASIDLRET